MLNISVSFLEGSKLLPEDMQYFTEVELKTLEKAVKETLEWREKQLDLQASTPLSQTPPLTVRSIAEKIDTLDREVIYFVFNHSSNFRVVLIANFIIFPNSR